DVLSDPQRHLLAAARRQPRIPALRLRGLRRDAAIDALADFLALRRAVGDRIVRVITGKGIGSPGEPVLKAAVVAWCAGEGADVVREWAPERERDGCYGALILALRPR
ncbi:MAG: Smr/MutS family protein, partial [Myxococcales bacterium]|nr:Smr/MutS family protein [Myxococcales bacterium]